MNGLGEIVFSASRADALIPYVETRGIWHAAANGEVKKLIEAGDDIVVNGVTETVVSVGFSDSTPLLRGNYATHSNTGQIIALARLNHTYQAILLITP